MLKHIKDAGQGFGDYHLQNPRDEKLVEPRGLDDHARGQARSGALRASTLMWCGGWMDSEKFSKLRPHEPS